MKKYTLFLSVFSLLSIILLGFNVNSAEAVNPYGYPDGTSATQTPSAVSGSSNVVTSCGVCATGHSFNYQTGQPCAAAATGSTGSAIGSSSSWNTLTTGSRGDSVKAIQQILKNEGYSLGTIDGVYGPRTARAIRDFQEDNSLPITGSVDTRTRDALSAFGSIPGSSATTCASGQFVGGACVVQNLITQTPVVTTVPPAVVPPVATIPPFTPPTPTPTSSTPSVTASLNVYNPTPSQSITLSGTVSGAGYTGQNCWAYNTNGGSSPTSGCWSPNGTQPSSGTGTKSITWGAGAVDSVAYKFFLCANRVSGPCADAGLLKVAASVNTPPVVPPASVPPVVVTPAVSNQRPDFVTDPRGPATLAKDTYGDWVMTAKDPDGTEITYSVNWGDNNNILITQVKEATSIGGISQGNLTHAYTTPGTYTILFTIKDASGISTTKSTSVTVY